MPLVKAPDQISILPHQPLLNVAHRLRVSRELRRDQAISHRMSSRHPHPFADQAPDLAAELGDGSLVLVDGAYHSPQLTHPTEWRAAVEAHLDRAAGSAKPTAG